MSFSNIQEFANEYAQLVVGITIVCAALVALHHFQCIRLRAALRAPLAVVAALGLVAILAGSVYNPPEPGTYELSAAPVQTNLSATEDTIPAPADHYATQWMRNGDLNVVGAARIDFHFNPGTRELVAVWSARTHVEWLAIWVVTSSNGTTDPKRIAPSQTRYHAILPQGEVPFSVTVAACAPQLAPASPSVPRGTCLPGPRGAPRYLLTDKLPLRRLFLCS